MIALATMQGMGKPGSNIYSTTQGVPTDYEFYFPGYAEGGISGDCENTAAGFKFAFRMFDGKTTFPSPSNLNTTAGQHIPRLKVPECIMDGKFKWSGKGFCGGDIQHQMHQYEYPAPGYPKIKMMWKYGGPWIGTMTNTNRYAKMYTHPSLEFVVSQSIWNEGEVQFADLVLPACTNFERWDISEFANCSGYIPDNFQQTNHRVISLQAKCIEPVGEGHSRLGPAPEQPGRPQGPADQHRQGRVHLHQHQELRGCRLRRRVPAGHAHLCARLGGPPLRARQEVPAGHAGSAPPLLFPHHG
jgi:anaerobic selenocysteine-containing dehydrogenase